MTAQPVAIGAGDGGAVRCYRWAAPATGRADVLVVHGLGDHGRALPYRLLAEALAAAGYGVVTYDQRGHGEVPLRARGRARWPLLLADLRLVTAELRQQAPVFTLGLSMGALVVLEGALDTGAGSAGTIALAAPLGRIGASPAAVVAARLLARLMPSLPVPAGLDLGSIARDAELVARYTEDPLFHTRVTAGLGADLLAVAARLHARPDGFARPLLLLHGGADRIAPWSDGLARALGPQRCETHVYQGALHNLLLERNRAQVYADVVGWLDRQGAASRPAA